MGWYEGAAQWAPLSTIPGVVVAAATNPVSSSPPLEVPLVANPHVNPQISNNPSAPQSAVISNLSSASSKPAETIINYIKNAWRLMPSMIRNPIETVDIMSTRFKDLHLLYTAIALYFIGMALIFVTFYFKFSDLLREFAGAAKDGISIEVLLKIILFLSTPFLALAIANMVLRKAMIPQKQFGFGYDMLASASALMPTQLATVVGIVVGVANIELIIVLSAYAIVLTTLITYSILLHSATNKASIVLLLSPIKILLAVYISKVFFTQLLGNTLIANLAR